MSEHSHSTIQSVKLVCNNPHQLQSTLLPSTVGGEEKGRSASPGRPFSPQAELSSKTRWGYTTTPRLVKLGQGLADGIEVVLVVDVAPHEEGHQQDRHEESGVHGPVDEVGGVGATVLLQGDDGSLPGGRGEAHLHILRLLGRQVGHLGSREVEVPELLGVHHDAVGDVGPGGDALELDLHAPRHDGEALGAE